MGSVIPCGLTDPASWKSLGQMPPTMDHHGSTARWPLCMEPSDCVAELCSQPSHTPSKLGTVKDEVALLATVTLLGVLLQAYFSLQVISARRAFRVSPPLTTGPPEFERVFRAQVNCSEYFPLFLATLWVAGIFFHEGAAALCGLVYLFARLRYFQGYARSAQLRLAPLYASARALWLLVALAALGLLVHFLPATLRAALLAGLPRLLRRP
ncbi:leukotriene C4 synthase [Cynocephalus volans]|uniref:leukotriene C4 synthase n=1 Tax=Cynocephalus volans TaxID=110931 RepID=UPI002FCC7973